MTSIDQRTAFLEEGEADAWLTRNKAQLAAPSAMRTAIASRIAHHLRADSNDVLEIGCGQGTNLIALGALVPLRACGIEPSSLAVELSREHPALDVRCGTSEALPWTDARFDLVWFGFCLYLVDRSLLFRTVAEADRVLRDGGLLAIVDFDPGAACRRPYHHRPDVWSYKMDYASLFLANPAYRLVEKISLSHVAPQWAPDPQDRVSLSILRKDTTHAYPVVD